MTKPTIPKAASRSRSRKAAAASTLIHPRAVPNIAPEPALDHEPDYPFAEGAHDELDSELRYRMISERAYHRYVERDFADGGELDDWLQAEAEVDHMLLNRETS